MASATHLVPYLNLIVTPVLWMVYMFVADRAKEEMLSLLRQEQRVQ